MPLPGGAADKFGNRYEGRWTVYCLLRIVHEKARSIHIEPAGDEGDGVEFILTNDQGVHEYHQVKRQRSKGAWNLQALERERILSRFRDKLAASEDARCVFVSMESAQELRELAERASSARDAREFEDEFTRDHENRRRLETLRTSWTCTTEQAYRWLRRIDVRTRTEKDLREHVEDLAGWLFESNERNVDSLLAALALDPVHQELDAIAILAYMRRHGVDRRRWNSDPHLLQRIQEITDNYAQRVRRQSILGTPIPRTEAQEVLDRMSGPSAVHAVMLTGGAGSGKTGVLAQVMERASEQGWAVLGFRLDGLHSAHDARQLGKQLDLPDSPVRVLAGVCAERRCLLVLDQLDAVSLVSGRQPELFECVDEMLRQSRMAEFGGRVHVVLSCRTFDLENDTRLRRLAKGNDRVAEEVTVRGLTREVVSDCLTKCGLESKGLGDTQFEFLSVPLHLLLVSELRETEHVLELDTLESLYRRFWAHEQRAVDARMGRPVRWVEIIDDVLDRMERAQALAVRADGVRDRFGQDFLALVSEGVLVQDGERVAFFHETFFDYAFARRFVDRGRRLPDFLREREQHLFVRGPVRQVLSYVRRGERHERRAYLEDLRALLTSDGIRFHVVHAVFTWLCQIPVPTNDEWEIVQECMTPENPERAVYAWRVVHTRPWFDLLDARGFIRDELSCGDSSREERMARYLSFMVRECPERVCEIALELALRDDPWPERAWQILRASNLESHHGFVALYARLLERGAAPADRHPLDDTSSESLLFTYELVRQQPAWALELFEAWLLHWLRHAERADEPNSFQLGDTGTRTHGDIESLAQAAPADFVERMLPIVLELVKRHASREGTPPWRDGLWDFWSQGESFRLEDELRDGMDRALRMLAGERPEIFEKHAPALRRHLAFRTPGKLLARAYAANGRAHADQAAAFLLSDTAWLELGWMGSGHWITRELLEAITPHCSEADYRALEEHVLAYHPERAWGDTRYLGMAQLALIPGFCEARRSPALQRRLGELQRKFDRSDAEPPHAITAEVVGPPVQANWDALGDEDWLRLVGRYDSDDWVTRVHPLAGGARELARVLEASVKREPERFARLIHQMPDNINPAYFGAVLRGIANAGTADPELAWNAMRRCHALPNRPCGYSMDDVLRAYAGPDMPDDILELAAWYATESPDPVPERGLDQADHENGLDNTGLNSVRGGMAWAFAELLFKHPAYLPKLLPHLRIMVTDPSVAARSMVANTLIPVLNVDRDLAVALFLELCDTEHDVLLQSGFLRQFLHHACYTHLHELLAIIDRMLASSHEHVAYQGAFLVVKFAPRDADTLEERVRRCVEGSPAMRRAAAHIAATNLREAVHRDRCEAILACLFDDPDKQVRQTAARCFRTLGNALGAHADLLQRFFESRSFPDASYTLFQAMVESNEDIPEITCNAMERLVEKVRDASAAGESIRPPRPLSADTLILRLYKRALSPTLQTRCLDLIDDMLRFGIGHKLPDELDRER